jgi:NAD(P)-dependent dehydrogenase (short-subunit alcohol dehydrogenase family)
MILVTGSSSGLGAALCRSFTGSGFSVLGISRSESSNCVDSLEIDLECNSVSSAVYSKFIMDRNISCTIINHGTLPRMESLLNIDPALQLEYLNLNYFSIFPIIQASYSAGCRKFLYVSSGAASSIYRGWSLYSMTKSLGELAFSYLRAEQPDASWLSVRPGIIDTRMNTHLRQVNLTLFPDFSKFRIVKAESVDIIASKIVQLVDYNWKQYKDAGMVDLREIELKKG